MTEQAHIEDGELFRRWRAAEGPGAAPDALDLAAYAEGRLEGASREAVGRWLAEHPQDAEMVDLALTVRAEDGEAAERVARRAASLVSGEVVAFRPRRLRLVWPDTARWGALAASVAIVGWLGFSLGGETYTALTGGDDQVAVDELFDPPTGFFGSFGAS